MSLYQGEDITIKLSGDAVVNLVDNEFVLLIAPYDKAVGDGHVVNKSECTRVEGENAYLYVLPHEKTSVMQGTYNIELLLKKDGDKRSIYKQDAAFFVDYSEVKNYGDSRSA